MDVPSQVWRIKICGITNAADAVAAAQSGAEAIGLNFYERSMRSVNQAEAGNIVNQVGATIAKVGVFVNHTAPQIVRLVETLGLDMVQLHGDQSPDLARELAPIPIVRAIRCHVDQTVGTTAEIAAWQACGPQLRMILLDARDRDRYGGSGKTIDWEAAARIVRDSQTPIALAGGLSAENVGRAIGAVAPRAVDVASGIESFPGKKDHDLMDQFIRSAQAAFARLSSQPGGRSASQ